MKISCPCPATLPAQNVAPESLVAGHDKCLMCPDSREIQAAKNYRNFEMANVHQQTTKEKKQDVFPGISLTQKLRLGDLS